MGNLEVMLPQNGELAEETQLASPSQLSSHPHTASITTEITTESWQRAEETTHEIICRIQPTVVSEERRKAVVEYVQSLIKAYLGSEVFPFGSVPLKTYLPDGDIDLTALSHQNVEDALANKVRAVLERMEEDKDAKFEVKDVQYIHAEVKLVKCLVQNIVVDISFNQLGGLCTLCFLEQVDRLIGKDHLFKRSIILIKAWCYYESRILGAHHGLISTYALETLVLYIFHLFHSSLHGPLVVLYRFLDYFSKFDWDNYGISLNGPVAVSSLPEIVAEIPENDGGDLLLSQDFLRNCVDLFSVPLKGYEIHMRSFPQKHLNIVDPLKENNNLGRSVSKGNFYRIRSAFTFGARKLGRILTLPGESMADELNKFFMNTLERHGSGQRPDVQDYFPYCRDSNLNGVNGSESAPLKSYIEKSEETKTVSGSPSVESRSLNGKTLGDGHGILCEEINSIKISVSEEKHGTGNQLEGHFSNHQPLGNGRLGCEKKHGSGFQVERHFSNHQPRENGPQTCGNLGRPLMMSELACPMEGDAVSGSRLAGDANDLATSRILSSRITNDLCKPSTTSNELGTISSQKVHLAPHLYYSRPFHDVEYSGNGNLDETKLSNSFAPKNSVSSGSQSPDEKPDHERKSASNVGYQLCGNNVGPVTASSNAGVLALGLYAHPPETSYLVNETPCCSELSNGRIMDANFWERDSAGASVNNTEASNSLSDLSGDYDSHYYSLQYGLSCHEHILYGPVIPFHPQSPSHYRNKSSWDAPRRSNHLKQSILPRINANGVGPGPLFPAGSVYYQPLISGAFGMEEMPKPRGTGTYFPNTNHQSYRDRPLGRGRSSALAGHNQLPRSRNGRDAAPLDVMSFSGKGSQELQSQAPASQLPVFVVNGRGKSSPTDPISYGHTVGRGFSHTNGYALPTERLEFGSLGTVQLVGAASSEQGGLLDSGASQHKRGSGSVLPMTVPRSGPNLNRERSILGIPGNWRSSRGCF
eukprot:TRINITY_DN1465_c1_g2_i2.p1 TRINITY_DN1465_c1_g2~~TRINITY_DN1465_c1_g2_i2.p1  ORF type:complete len:984 (-),score=174.72 TRINITY_DN1465_c1_g2_i2:957-3908(-)